MKVGSSNKSFNKSVDSLSKRLDYLDNDSGNGKHHEGFRFGAGGFGHGFGLARLIPILIFIVWLGIGIRQWFVLSKWTKRYERYKELQKKIDEKLDYDSSNDAAIQ